MKIKKNISTLLLLGALSSVSSAAVISINFTRPASSTDLAAVDSAGVEAATNWTNLSGTSTSGTDLQTDSGASTVDFTRSGAANAFDGGADDEVSPDNRLMSDYTDVTGTAVTWTFTDLNINGFITYDVIVFTAGGSNSGRFGDYTIGGTTIRSTDVADFDSDGAGYIESTGTSGASTNGNYVRFSGITGDSFSITAVGANAVTARGPVNGFQIVAVPEPSSTALLGLGGLTLILRRRK